MRLLTADGHVSGAVRAACISLAFSAACVLASPVLAGGKYAAEFLKIGVGARALGLGGAFVAIADDGSAPYWNPAGLARAARPEMLFMHAEQFGSIANHDFASFVQPLDSRSSGSAVAISLVRFSVDDILVTRDAYDDRNHNGRRDEGEPILPDRFYMDSDTEYALLLSYARATGDRLSLGGNLKLIRQGLLDNTSFGMGLDLGLLYRPTASWGLGVRLADATTTRISWDTGHRETLRPALTFGAAWTRDLPGLRGRLNTALALANTFDGRDAASQIASGAWGGDLQAGLEYWVGNASAFGSGRKGHGSAVAARVGSDAGALTAGAGIRYRSWGVDYAFLSHEELDATHRVSASIGF
jgi:hypothetical protein